MVVGVLALGGGVLWWCNSRIVPAPEAVQQALDDAVKGVETNDVGLIMDHVSDDFRGDFGGEVVTRRELKQRLFFVLRRGVEVEIVRQDVEVFDESATVTVVVALWAGGLSGAASGDATAREIELEFRLEGSDWKVVEARQRRADLEDAL